MDVSVLLPCNIIFIHCINKQSSKWRGFAATDALSYKPKRSWYRTNPQSDGVVWIRRMSDLRTVNCITLSPGVMLCIQYDLAISKINLRKKLTGSVIPTASDLSLTHLSLNLAEAYLPTSFLSFEGGASVVILEPMPLSYARPGV
jgi:hypothetical protein